MRAMVWRTRYTDASQRLSLDPLANAFHTVGTFLLFCLVSLAVARLAWSNLPDATPTLDVHLDRQIELETRFVPEKGFRVGQPLTFEVVVKWLDVGENLSTRLAESPTFENLDVISTSTRSSTRATSDGRLVEEVYSFLLVPGEQGPARAGAVEVIYERDGEEQGRLSSVARDISVGPPARALNVAYPAIAGAIVVVIVASVGVAWLLLKRRRAKQPSREAERKSPFEELLAEARRWRLEGDTGRYYGTLERAVRQALSDRYAYGDASRFSAKELPAEIDGETRRLIESFFTRCTEGKYAPAKPTGEELDRIWEDANRLLSLG